MRKKVIERLETVLTANAKPMARALDKNVVDTKNWSKRVIGIAAGVGAALGVRALVGNVVEATRIQEHAIAQLQRGLISTNNAVGLSFDELTAHARELQKVTTFGDEEIIRAQSQLVTFTKIAGGEFLKTTELAADLSIRMGGDLTGAVKQLGKALNDPVKNLSALGEAGIQFTKDQETLIKSLWEAGRTSEAQRLILKELEVQFGGSARAARNTFGGALQAVSNAASDLLEADSASLPALQKSLEDLTATLSDPKTVESAHILTNAIIKSFNGATKAITGTVNIVQFLGEELAAAVNGPAIDDIVRMEDRLESVTEKLAKLNNASSRSGVHRQVIKERIEALEEEEAQLRKNLQIARQAQEELYSRKARTQSSGQSKESGGDSAGVIAPTAGVVEALEQYENKLQRQIDLYGETSRAVQLRYDLEHGNIKGLEEANQQQINSLVQQAAAIDDLAAAEKKANEDRLAAQALERELKQQDEALLRDVDSLAESLTAESETLQQAHANRLAMLEDARNRELITEQRHAELVKKVDNDLMSKQVQSATKGFSVLLNVASRYYDGVNTKQAARMRVALALGDALLDKEKRDAIKSIGINTWKTAMLAYQSLAGIPYIGPALGAGAAGIVITAGTAYAANVAGIAHGGLDNVPKESTYLLDKGERVLSPNQNQDLTSFLQNNRTNGGGKVEVIINEAPGVETSVRREETDGMTRLTIDQKLREIVQDEMRIQQLSGGILDRSYAV